MQVGISFQKVGTSAKVGTLKQDCSAILDFLNFPFSRYACKVGVNRVIGVDKVIVVNGTIAVIWVIRVNRVILVNEIIKVI